MRRWFLVFVGWWAICDAYAAPGAGAALFKQHCAVCHGDRGDGQSRVKNAVNPPPRDFTAPQAREELTRERMITSVTYGRPGTAMMSFSKRLSAAEIATVVDFIRTDLMHLKGDETRGKALYKRNCSACHGENGNAATWAKASLNPPPRNFTDPASREELSLERMITSVTYGRPGTAMMPFAKRLTPAEIREVVGYVRTTFMRGTAATLPPSHPALPRMAAPAVNMNAVLPNGLRGDAARGEEFFQHNCYVCHGRAGMGDGPRAKFNIPRPRDFTSEDTRSRFNRPQLFDAIRKGKPGTVMPAWGAVLNQQQIADIAEYVFTNFVRPDKKKAR